jgi:tRNA uridine 5-carbamoylmethylation protein Kti12
LKEVAKKVKLKDYVDANNITISRDGYFRSAYVIDLPLDSVPDHVWQDILDREWRASLRLWDRKLFVVGDKLRLVTTLDDIEGKLDWVKQVIGQTNEGIDEYNKEINARKTQKEDETHKQIGEEQANIDSIRASLKKTFGAF